MNSSLAPSLILKHLRVLVVEDEPDLMDLLTFILEEAGAEVISVVRSSEALSALEHEQPDIMLCNIRLPDEDGCCLIRKIRSREAEAGDRILPAIAVTSYGREVGSTWALAAGFHQYMSKPIDPDELVAAVVSLTGRNN